MTKRGKGLRKPQCSVCGIEAIGLRHVLIPWPRSDGSNGLGVFARAHVHNSIGRNVQLCFVRESCKGVVPFGKGEVSHPKMCSTCISLSTQRTNISPLPKHF